MSTHTNRSIQDIEKWFRKEKFTKAHFRNNKENITTYWLDQPIHYKLAQCDGYTTFWREAYGGALIVFEISLEDKLLTYNGYCPVLVFGIWNMKISFKENAGMLMKYRAEGYKVKQKFEAFLGH